MAHRRTLVRNVGNSGVLDGLRLLNDGALFLHHHCIRFVRLPFDLHLNLMLGLLVDLGLVHRGNWLLDFRCLSLVAGVVGC